MQYEENVNIDDSSNMATPIHTIKKKLKNRRISCTLMSDHTLLFCFKRLKDGAVKKNQIRLTREAINTMSQQAAAMETYKVNLLIRALHELNMQ